MWAGVESERGGSPGSQQRSCTGTEAQVTQRHVCENAYTGWGSRLWCSSYSKGNSIRSSFGKSGIHHSWLQLLLVSVTMQSGLHDP